MQQITRCRPIRLRSSEKSLTECRRLPLVETSRRGLAMSRGSSDGHQSSHPRHRDLLRRDGGGRRRDGRYAPLERRRLAVPPARRSTAASCRRSPRATTSRRSCRSSMRRSPRPGATGADLDAIAVTAGPGPGRRAARRLNTAKALAYAHGVPLLGVNHLEAHLYANWLEVDGAVRGRSCPPLGLIVSGGHTDLVLMRDHGRLPSASAARATTPPARPSTRSARLLGLGFPGGPAIERAAARPAPKPAALPRAWLGGSDDFSFSGLKTAVLHVVRGDATATPPVPRASPPRSRPRSSTC